MRRVLASVLIIVALLLSGASPTLALLSHACDCDGATCNDMAMGCADGTAQCSSGQCARLLPTSVSVSIAPALIVTWGFVEPALGSPDRATGPNLRPPNF